MPVGHLRRRASEELILNATENLAALRVQHARLTRERRQAETSWLKARATAREEVRTACQTHKRQLVGRINDGLTAAATASRELAELEDRERGLTGS
jgi:ribosome recycling factor